MGLLVQILMGKLPEQPRVGIPSMSAGSGDGEAKSEVEESLPVLYPQSRIPAFIGIQ